MIFPIPRVLLLEDTPYIGEGIKKMLTEIGFLVIWVETVGEARQIIQTDRDFDLVVIDIDMGGGPLGTTFIIKDAVLLPETCERIVYTGHPNQKVNFENTQWMFILKGGTGTGQLERCAEAALQLAITRRRTLPARDHDLEKRVISRASVKKWENVFVLGCFEKRKTFYSQQVRALELCRVLKQSGKLENVRSVGVIGAGSGGSTAAVAMALLGVKTSLYEKATSILHLQEAAPHRFLHPHLYDWPQEGALEDDAGLPFLNWRAGNANLVARDLRLEFETFIKEHRNVLELICGKEIISLKRIGNASLTVTDVAGMMSNSHDLIILSQGFGLEDSTSYWSGDKLDGPHGGRILISGSGDGGLIDLARACLRSNKNSSHCNHEELIKVLTENPDVIALAKKMHEMESRNEAVENLFSLYSQIDIPESLKQLVCSLKREENMVFFNHNQLGIFTKGSALINRLVAFLIIKLNIVDLQNVLQSMMYENGQSSDGLLRASFFRDGRVVRKLEFNLIFSRHGANAEKAACEFLIPMDDIQDIKSVCDRYSDIPRLCQDTFKFWKLIGDGQVNRL